MSQSLSAPVDVWPSAVVMNFAFHSCRWEIPLNGRAMLSLLGAGGDAS